MPSDSSNISIRQEPLNSGPEKFPSKVPIFAEPFGINFNDAQPINVDVKRIKIKARLIPLMLNSAGGPETSSPFEAKIPTAIMVLIAVLLRMQILLT